VTEVAVIVDRYAGKSLYENGNASGLAWLGERLLVDGVQRIVLVTASGPVSDTQIGTGIQNLGNAALRAALRVELRPDGRFKRFAHDRFILLQAGRVASAYSVGKGLAAFEGNVVRQNSSFANCDGGTVVQTLADLGVDISAYI